MSSPPPRTTGAPALKHLADSVQRATDEIRAAVATLNPPPPPPPPKPPAAVVLNSFGFSTAPGISPTAAERSRKADADAVRARQDALPPEVAPWHGRLALPELEALAAVWRAFKAHDRVPVALPRADLAEQLGVAPEHAEALLNRLAGVGAVERNLRLKSAVRYAPVAAPPAPKPASSRKAAAAPAKPDPSAPARLRAALGVRR